MRGSVYDHDSGAEVSDDTDVSGAVGEKEVVEVWEGRQWFCDDEVGEGVGAGASPEHILSRLVG